MKKKSRNMGKIYGRYFITGLDWSGVMLMLYMEIMKLVIQAVTLNKLR